MTFPALLNHLWQSTAFAAVAAALAFALRCHQARVRFWVWMAASLKFLVPFSLLAAAGSQLESWFPAPVTATPPATLVAVSQPFQLLDWSVPAATSVSGGHFDYGLLLLGFSLAVSAALAVRWFCRWLRLFRLVRTAKPRQLAGVPARVTEAAVEPGVFGIFRPVLLLPAGLEQRLAPEQLAAVLAHERCHLQRHDNLWSALHMLVETLFWFHPLVWYAGARMVEERERACDQEVLRQGGDAAAYAGGILAVGRFYLESPLACAAGVTGGGLKQRVAAILRGARTRQLSRGRQLLLITAAVAALLGPLAAGIVFGQATPPLPTAFDAATIKPAAPPTMGPGGRMMMRAGVHSDPGRLTIENETLKEMIQDAYHLKPYQVTGPDWLSGQRWNVNAETTAPLTHDQMLTLLQPFLVQQFQLKSHQETKTVPVYDLVVAPGGSKLNPYTPGEALPMPPMADGRGTPPPPNAIMMSMSGSDLTLTAASTLPNFADTLARQLGRPVLDRTGLTGPYLIHLTYAPTNAGAMGMKMGPPPLAGARSGPDGGDNSPAAPPSLFTALQEQLGLKLQPAKGPVELLVVDQANKTPLGN